jgi:hypothetical protein
VHRFPPNLDLGPLLGLEVVQVAIGQNEVIVIFAPQGMMRLEGAWVLRDREGEEIDRSTEHSIRDAWRVPRLLGRKLSGFVLRDESTLVLSFDGVRLEIEDDSDHYETFAFEHPLLTFYV